MDQTTLIISGCVLVILLIAYIIALVKSKRGELVFTYNNWDMTLLLLCPVLLLVGSIVNESGGSYTAVVIICCVAAVSLLGSIVFSIIHNKPSFGKILCSVLGKLFVVLLTLFVIFIFIVYIIGTIIFSLMSSNKDSDEYIVLKYDKYLRAYVGYRYYA